ncbi:nitroreductase [Calocera cornea HHB12733]|uniref:Nitroreductase n=1 Tax=Calocera cornea HHB12733 TaxID=1353952 RepID=A0A165GQZ1_9BASI|nr:nitroreductase [Calocera cornea HHB12733]
MASGPSPSTAFLEVAKERRSYYSLKKGSPIPDAKIIEIVQEALKQAPSSFNSQTSRVVVLFGADHDWLWDMVLEVLKPIAPPEVYPNTVKKINNCFKSGHGTVLFFEDNSAVKGMQEMYPLYQERFPGWAHETSAIIQFITWCTLEKEGLGASLQHYNPLIDERVREKFNLPVTWFLTAQMPFGNIAAPADPKDFMPMEERFKAFGAKL